MTGVAELKEMMKAMALSRPGRPLELIEKETPRPGAGELLLRVLACGVCRTDLHVVDGELPDPALPITPGHEIVGAVEAMGSGVSGFALGQRVGVPWLGKTCGCCSYCESGHENLCDHPLFTGYTRDGGYATQAIADASFCFPLDETEDPAEQAPLLCAGLIGWRSLKMTSCGFREIASRSAEATAAKIRDRHRFVRRKNTKLRSDRADFVSEARKLGIYGFGAAAHIVAQVARFQGRSVFAFVRPGDEAARDFALSLGAVWAGGSDQAPPEPLDAAIIFAPVGALVPRALAAVKKGGVVVCGGIHMSDIPSFPYALLWEERKLLSVANLTREDAREFLALAPKVGIKTHVVRYPLAAANEALADLREGRLQGAAVLIP
jgi:alcohol dehydrogenase, propanol-preferring